MVKLLGNGRQELPDWIKKPKNTRALVVIHIADDNVASMFVDISYIEDDDETAGDREAVRILDEAATVIARSHFESKEGTHGDQ